LESFLGCGNNKKEDFAEYGGIPEGPASRGFYGAL
jgi:hypothetical protein